MQTAIIGLGKIGKNICLHLLEQGVSVVAYNRSRDDVDEVVERGAVGAYTLGELSTQLAVGRSQKVEDSGQLASQGQGGLAGGSGQNDKTSLQLSAISDQTEMTSPPPNRRGNTFGHDYDVQPHDKRGSVEEYEKLIPPLIKRGEGGVLSSSVQVENEVSQPLIVLLFLPAGSVVDEVLFGARANMNANESHPVREKVQAGLVDLLPAGSIIIDGGNSFYKDSLRRYSQLKTKGFQYLDMGTSGGLEGARQGASLMVGGDEEIFQQVRPVLEKIAVENGLGYVGPAGAGHFVKMVHNGIEYAIVQAWGEGFELLHKSEFDLNLSEVARVYKNGSIIRGYIADLLERALKKDPNLSTYEGRVGGGQTGAWTQIAALDLGVKTPALDAALETRKMSLKDPTFTGKVISALRREWGGHGEG